MALKLTTRQGLIFQFTEGYHSGRPHILSVAGKLTDGTEVDLEILLFDSERHELRYMLDH